MTDISHHVDIKSDANRDNVGFKNAQGVQQFIPKVITDPITGEVTDLVASGRSAVSDLRLNRDVSPRFVENLVTVGMTEYHSAVENSTLVVSGVKGDRFLTYVSGSLANFFNANAVILSIPGVIEDNSGTNWFVMIDQIVGSSPGSHIEIDEPLPVSVTNGTLYSKILNQQHLTTNGYKALANRLFRANPAHAAIANMESIFSINPDDDWASTTLPNFFKVSGTAPPTLYVANLATQHAANDGWVFAAQDRSHKMYFPGSGSAVLTATIPMDGASSGYIVLEAALPAAYVAPGQVVVSSTSKTVLSGTPATTKTKIYTGTFYRNVRRFVIPFAACSELEVVIQRTVGDGCTDGRVIYVGQFDVVVGKAVSTEGLINSSDTVLMMGDSWTDPLGQHAGFSEELARLSGANIITSFNYVFPDASTGVVRSGQGNATSAYGLDWLQIALDQNPGVNKVVFHYYTNDSNSGASISNTFDLTAPNKSTKNYNICTIAGSSYTYGDAANVWANNMQSLIDICLANGVQPIVMMPCAVSSFSQTTNHAVMNYMIGQPHKSHKIQVASAADLAKKWNPANSRGKHYGKVVCDPSPGGAAMLMYVANGPLPTDTWQQYGSATTITPV